MTTAVSVSAVEFGTHVVYDNSGIWVSVRRKAAADWYNIKGIQIHCDNLSKWCISCE